MKKNDELRRAEESIQADLKGKALLRVDYSALKKDDVSHSENAMFFLAAGWYRDQPFHCRDCGILSVWTAEKQKWWYEVAKGSVLTAATRCASCREVSRAEKTKHKKKTEAGYEKKRRDNAV